MQKALLRYIAEDIVKKWGTDLSKVVVVFPNKRASLFLNEYIFEIVGHPTWSPRYITISELMRRHSRRTVCDPIEAVCLLYDVYCRTVSEAESIDRFWSWGEMILADFDDLDKNMGDARKVYCNVRDIHEFDSADYLTEDQRTALRQFFLQFEDDHDSVLKQRFERLWNNLHRLYTLYNTELEERGLAYEGALYREVAEKAGETEWSHDHYLFVGFNMMQKSEQRILRQLQKQGKAHFYWDFDHYYTDSRNHEAGKFIREYLSVFPNELDSSDGAVYNCLSRPKDVCFLSASTEDIQARYVAQWLQEGGRCNPGELTAVVLADERLLPSVVNCLPASVTEGVNITIGYPLVLSTVCGVVRSMLSARKPMDEIIDQVKTLGQDTTDPMQQEAAFRMFRILNRIDELQKRDVLRVEHSTLMRLYDQIVRSSSMPFHGEPVVGVQVMGVLETRNLDFDHLLILSCNEGNLPKGINDSSLIPFSVRKAHGLTTVDNKVAIYAYYFYRMLQRCGDVHICWNASTEDGHTGQMSRFMLQLMVEAGNWNMRRGSLEAVQNPCHMKPKTVEKTPEVMERMMEIKSLSPSAVNRYLRCPLLFYYQSVCNIRQKESDDVSDVKTFGIVFHETMELIFNELSQAGGLITRQAIEALLQEKGHVTICRHLDKAFSEHVFGGEKPDYNGQQFISREVMKRFCLQVLEQDCQTAPFTMLGSEVKVGNTFRFDTPAGPRALAIYGYIDRLDKVTDEGGRPCIRVIDYKTGRNMPEKIAGVEDIFRPENIDNHSDYFLQTMLYSMLQSRETPGIPVQPALLFVQHRDSIKDPVLCFQQGEGRNKTSIRISDVAEYKDEFMAQFHKLISEIFDPSVPFKPTEQPKRCSSCPYRNICSE